jgi:hypothetical protein
MLPRFHRGNDLLDYQTLRIWLLSRRVFDATPGTKKTKLPHGFNVKKPGDEKPPGLSLFH